MAALKTTESRPSDSDVLGQLAGEYRILRKLGVGGFGAVYEAEHPVLKRRAAVKVLHALPGVDSVAVQRFIEEARSASQIRHRHIVDTFSFGQLSNGQYFYVMDLLEGAPLDAFLKERGRIEPGLAVQLLRPVANAIDALHAASIVHRDLKPANIYLAWEGHEVVPKLLDFGLVKLLGAPSVNTASGVPMGTPFYMSPEQCRGEKVDARADIYSFGVVCFELLTGSRPFTGDSTTAVLVAHLMQPPPKPTERAPELPTALDEPVLHMLAKEPDDRPSSAVLALQAIEAAARAAGIAIADGLPQLPRPTSQPAPVPSAFATTDSVGKSRSQALGPRSGRRALGAFALVAVLLAGYAAVSYRIQRGTEINAVEAPALTKDIAPPETREPNPPAEPASTHETAPAAAPERRVTLTLRGAPPGAAVLLGEEKLGEAPGPVLLPYGEAPITLTILAPGTPPRSLSVTPNRALDVELANEKSTRPSRKQNPRSHDLENPF